MSQSQKKRRKATQPRYGASAGGRERTAGLKEAAPTPERLLRGDIRLEASPDWAPLRVSDRDWTGDRPPGPAGRACAARVNRDLNASVRRRLARYKDLSPVQISAAERLERDWELARTEPRMVANLAATAGQGGWKGGADVAASVLDARERLHQARQSLRRAGPDVLRVVEGVVFFEATADSLGAPLYSGRRDASVYVRTLLGIGLNILAAAG